MQGIELLLLSVGILVAVAYFATTVARRRRPDHPLAAPAVGPGPGGHRGTHSIVFNAARRRPRRPRAGGLGSSAVVVITVGLILGTSYRFARR